MILMGEGTRTLGLLEYQATFPIFPLLWTHSFASSGGTGEWGSGHFELSIHVPLGMAGRTIHHQAVVFDPEGPGGVTVSNVVRASYVTGN